MFLHDGLEPSTRRGRKIKRTRFTEEQVIGILKEAEAGAKSKRGLAAIGRPIAFAFMVTAYRGMKRRFVAF